MANNPKHDNKPNDTRPIQLNPTSEAFWQSRGYPARPADWQTRDPSAPPPVPSTPKK